MKQRNPRRTQIGFVELVFLANVTESPSLDLILSFQTRGAPDSSSLSEVVG